MAVPDQYRALDLGGFNPGVSGANALLTPLCAQLDSLISAGIGPFQRSLGNQFNAALSAQAQLGLELVNGNIFDVIKQALAALAQLQAALALSLGAPPPELSVSTSLSSTAALVGALKIQLAAIKQLIKAALAVKAPALSLSAVLTDALGQGPFIAVSFSSVQLQAVSSWLSSEVSGGGLSADGTTIGSTDPTFGVLIFGKDSSTKAALDAIISVPSP